MLLVHTAAQTLLAFIIYSSTFVSWIVLIICQKFHFLFSDVVWLVLLPSFHYELRPKISSSLCTAAEFHIGQLINVFTQPLKRWVNNSLPTFLVFVGVPELCCTRMSLLLCNLSWMFGKARIHLDVSSFTDIQLSASQNVQELIHFGSPLDVTTINDMGKKLLSTWTLILSYNVVASMLVLGCNFHLFRFIHWEPWLINIYMNKFRTYKQQDVCDLNSCL